MAYAYVALSPDGAKSRQEYLKHAAKLAAAKAELKRLQNQLNGTKGPKKRGPLQKLIDDLRRLIRGHEKEIDQKWPDEP